MTKQELLTLIRDAAAKGEVSDFELLEAYKAGGGHLEAERGLRRYHFDVTKILYAIGGIVVVAGLVFLIQQMWDTFGAFAQILVTLGSSIALYVAAVFFTRVHTARVMSIIFFVMAAALMPLGIFVALFHLSSGDNVWLAQIVMSAIPAGVYMITYWLFRRPALLMVGILFVTWFLYALTGYWLDVVVITGDFAVKLWAYLTLAVGFSYGWIGYVLRPSFLRDIVGLLYFFGSAAVLGAGYALTFIQDAWVFFYFVLILGAIYLSTFLHSRSFLIFGALALILHLTHISFEYFAESLSWPLALIISGFIIIGVGYGTVVLHKRFITGTV